MTKKQVICFVAGGSGGHIVPSLTLARECKKNGFEILFFSTCSALDDHITASFEIDYHIKIALRKTPRLVSFNLVKFLWQTAKAFMKSSYWLIKLKPTKIISTGGFISIPVCLAAWLLRIPIELYELNATPGKAVLFLSRFACGVFTCFEHARQFFKQTTLTNYPIRFTASSKITKHAATAVLQQEAHVSINPDLPVLLVLGGSQGSRFINNLIKQIIDAASSQQPLQILHQTGTDDLKWLQQYYQEKKINGSVFAYVHDLHAYYCAADLVIARAGAGTLFELLFFQKPSIIIPLSTRSTDHQVANANALSREYSSLFSVIMQDSIERDQRSLLDTVCQKLQNKTVMRQ